MDVNVIVGDRVVLVEAKQAQAIEAKKRILEWKSRNITRDIYESGLLRGGPANSLAGWTCSAYCRPAPVSVVNTVRVENKLDKYEALWQKHIAKVAA